MPNVPKKVAERLSKQLRRFQRILRDAKDRDVNESDTVTIIVAMLEDLFGFDKFTDVTSEHRIGQTYCDLAVKDEGAIKYLIEVKAIGLTLNTNHVRKARDYGASQGISFVVLANGIDWEVYRIKRDPRIDCVHTCSIEILELSGRKREDIERLYILCKEGLAKAAMEEFHEHVQNVNRFVLAAVIQCDTVLGKLRLEVDRTADGARVTKEEIKALLPDVLKRDVVEGESAKEARRRVKKAASTKLKKSSKKSRKSSKKKPKPAPTPEGTG